MRSGRPRWACAAVLAGLLGTASAAPPQDVVLLDLERGEPLDGWELRGDLALSEHTVEPGATPSSGRSLALRAEGGARGAIERELESRDWRPFRALAFHARVEAEAPIAMRVVVRGGEGRRGRLRRFALEPGPWREVVLPLADFREDVQPRVGSFLDVRRLELRWDAGAGRVEFDDLRLVAGDRGEASCRKRAEEWLELAGLAGGRARSAGPFLLLTAADVPEEELRAAAARLEQVPRLLAEAYGLPPVADAVVPVFAFADEERYRAFFARLGDHFGVGISAPSADGYSVLGVAATWRDEGAGLGRPVLVHEATHAYVHAAVGVPSNGSWLQEGLAAAVQVRLHPESAASVDFADGFDRLARWSGPFRPWRELLAQERAPMASYAQLATVLEFLADRRADRLPAFWDAIARDERPIHQGAVPILAETLGTTPADLEHDWLDWGRERWPAER